MAKTQQNKIEGGEIQISDSESKSESDMYSAKMKVGEGMTINM